MGSINDFETYTLLESTQKGGTKACREFNRVKVHNDITRVVVVVDDDDVTLGSDSIKKDPSVLTKEQKLVA